MALTADTITDEQIRELLLGTPLFGNRHHEIVAYAALYPARTASEKKAVRAARAECAEILNARAKESK